MCCPDPAEGVLRPLGCLFVVLGQVTFKRTFGGRYSFDVHLDGQEELEKFFALGVT